MDKPALFLSYHSDDRASVVAVQKLLAARGITTFLDRYLLAPGLPWPEALEEVLRGVRAVAVFIGTELGGWQKRELWFALDRQVREEKQGHPFPVIPVLLPGADPTPSFLFTNTWIDLRAGLDSVAVGQPIEAFEHAIATTAPPTASSAERAALCPYRGLEAFREEHAAFFAGRGAFARQLFDFILGKDLVAVVGPSGSGKSSVVQAGLVPLLRRRLPPETTWDVVTFTPGTDPFLRLASALAPLLEQNLSETDRLAEGQKLGERLDSGEIRLESVIGRVIEKSNGTGRLLVVADQFEELFTLTPGANRRPFVGALLGALGKARFTLLVTLRADFYSQIITLDRELSDRLAPAQVNIGALTRDELRESMSEPARLVGLDFEAGLVDRILRDVGSEPGNLPLLEFALTGLWSRREGRTLSNAAYNTIGGVTGALAQRAEEEFSHFAPEEKAAARRLLMRLVRVARPEEGAEDTRQRIELRDTDPVEVKVAQVLARPEVRLLVMGRPEGEGQTSQTVEVAHEALIRNWKQLRGWLNEDRGFLLWRQRMQIQVEQWEQHGCDAGYLLRGPSLAEAEGWRKERKQDLTATEERFISESLALREREREEEEQRQRAQALAEAEAKSARSLRRAAFGLGVMLVLAIVASIGAAAAMWTSKKNLQKAIHFATRASQYTQFAREQYALLAKQARDRMDPDQAKFYEELAATANSDTLLANQLADQSTPRQRPQNAPLLGGQQGSPIRHLIVVMMENRSFDHMLGALKESNPEIDGLTGSESNPDSTGSLVKVQPLAADQGQLDNDPDTHFPGVDFQIFAGDSSLGRMPNMQGFVRSYSNQQPNVERSKSIMYYFKPDKLPVLTTLAKEFAVCDHWFSSVPGPGVPNRAFAQYGTSYGQVGANFFFMGEPYKSIFERMVTSGRTAKIYYWDLQSFTPEMLPLLRSNPQFFSSFEQFVADSKQGTLPEYSFVEPVSNDHVGQNGAVVLASDQHPDHSVLQGERFIAQVYNAIRVNESLWRDSILLITYSNHGGIYDHVPPPAATPDGFVAPPMQTGTGKPFDFDRLGVRVPAVIVSPYISKGTVDHTIYDHASIPATVSKLFLSAPQNISPRERSANTFDRVLTLTTPRPDNEVPVFEFQ